ncbi:hypothetical protein, partial [Kocuria rosea]|uniref:hypothetical protein n=1 Tax=Kocuria rosea TaxID=1275 RepID=UPI001C92F203
MISKDEKDGGEGGWRVLGRMCMRRKGVVGRMKDGEKEEVELGSGGWRGGCGVGGGRLVQGRG